MKLTADQLRRASSLAEQVRVLENLRDIAEDTQVVVRVGAPSPHQPLGSPTFAALQGKGPVDTGVVVTVPATTIRAALVDRLAPLYTELRALGIELERC